MNRWASLFLALFFASALYAGDVHVDKIRYEEKKANFYVLSGTLTNDGGSPREAVVRGQLTFYDKASPKGDVPVAVVRKDITVVLRTGEIRNLEIPLYNEGRMPAGSFRAEPMLRIRREREWNY